MRIVYIHIIGKSPSAPTVGRAPHVATRDRATPDRLPRDAHGLSRRLDPILTARDPRARHPRRHVDDDAHHDSVDAAPSRRRAASRRRPRVAIANAVAMPTRARTRRRADERPRAGVGIHGGDAVRDVRGRGDDGVRGARGHDARRRVARLINNNQYNNQNNQISFLPRNIIP